MTARLLNVTPEQYFADPCETPSLSSSIARTLVTKSPAHAWTEHPRFGAERRDATSFMNDGTIIHALLLDKELETIEVIAGFDDFRKKAAKELRDEALEAGKVPILEHKYQVLEATANTLRSRIGEYGIDFKGRSEVAIEWREDGNIPGSDGVLCRCKMDHVYFDTGVIYDVKKITSADGRTRSKHSYDYGYDIQRAAYTSALEHLIPELAGRIDFVFIFCELEPPYAVVPCRPTGVMRALGEMRWMRAVALWEHCLAHNDWPSYARGIVDLEPPAWALKQEEFDGAEL